MCVCVWGGGGGERMGGCVCVCERYGWMRTVLSYPLFVHIMS